MAQLALIIGNGFDLDLGLPSKYSDFMDSPEWNNIFSGVRSIMYKYNMLKRTNKECWQGIGMDYKTNK